MRRSLSKALSWALIHRLQTMRGEIEGYPKSDSVRLTVLRSLERNNISSHGTNRRVRRHQGDRTRNPPSLGLVMSQWVKTIRLSGHSKNSKSDSPLKFCDEMVTFGVADDDPAARPDNHLYRGYTEHDRSTGRPDGHRDQRTQ